MKKGVKLSLLSLALGACISAYADNNSTIPTTTPGFSVSITGLYLEPNASNLNYAVYTTPLPAPSPNWQQENVNPEFSPAFDLGVQYTLADTVDQLSLDWLYVSTSDSSSVGPAGPNTSYAPPYYFGPYAQALINSTANSTVKFDVDDVNLAFGHLINLSNHIQIEPFVSINTAYLKENISSTYTGQDSNHKDYAITSNETSDFTGAGPRLGFNSTYFITNRFGISAEMAASLLVGSLNSNTTFNSFYSGVVGNDPAVTTTLADQSQTKVVPEIDAKVAAEYSIPFNTNGSSLTISAGYMFDDYINGIDQVVPTALVPNAFNNGTIAVESSSYQASDLSLNGPFVSIAWKF